MLKLAVADPPRYLRDLQTGTMVSARGLTIGEVARRAGLRPSAIRYYEAVGLLPEPKRVSEWRRYGETVFTRLAVIDLAQQAGFSLDEIRTLLDGFSRQTRPPARWAALARKKLPDVEALIARARAMKRLLIQGIECSCLRIEDCPGILRRVRAMAESAER
jgi:MerR family redox-sensitive transcriptional activator SoxR